MMNRHDIISTAKLYDPFTNEPANTFMMDQNHTNLFDSNEGISFENGWKNNTNNNSIVWISRIMDYNISEDDVVLLRIIFAVAFCLYLLSLGTLGKCSITHQWLFSNLTVFQPTSESIIALQRQHPNSTSSGSNAAQQQRRNVSSNNNFRRHHQNDRHSSNNNTSTSNRHRNNHTTRRRRNNEFDQHDHLHHHQNQEPQNLYTNHTVHSHSSTTSLSLDDQLSVLEFTKVHIQNGVIALQQYRRSRNQNNTSSDTNANNRSMFNNNNNITTNGTMNPTISAATAGIASTTLSSSTTNTCNHNDESFTLWKCLETTVIQCLACFAILMIRWISHVRYCHAFATVLFDPTTGTTTTATVTIPSSIVTSGGSGSAIQRHLDEWDYAESNRARWWLMVFVLITIRTWFYMSYLASMSHKGYISIRFTPLSYITAIVFAYCAWRYVGAKQSSSTGNSNLYEGGLDETDENNEANRYNTSTTITIDGALDELTSRLLLLVRLIGWKMNQVHSNSNNHHHDHITIVWDIIRRGLRIAVTIFCGCFGFVIADPIFTIQYAMIYRLYVGSGNDIHINQKYVKYNASRWTHTQSKRVFCMECMWKCLVTIALLVPTFNAYFVLVQYGWYDDHYDWNNSDTHTNSGSSSDNSDGFSTHGSKRLLAHLAYVGLLCVLVRRFQQDYLLSALPSVVLALDDGMKNEEENDNTTSTRSSTSTSRNRQQGNTTNAYTNHSVRAHGNNNNNNSNNDDDDNANDDEDDNFDANENSMANIHQRVTFPFVLRIETILRNGSKLCSIPLMLIILFTVNHTSDFQRGPTIFPSAYGGPWLSRTIVQKWHQERIQSQISSFIVLSPPLSPPTSTTTSTTNSTDTTTTPTRIMKKKKWWLFGIPSSSASTTTTSSSSSSSSSFCNVEQENIEQNNRNVFQNIFRSIRKKRHHKKDCPIRKGNLVTVRNVFDLKAVTSEPLTITLLSALRKLQKLAQESLKDNYVRSCLTGYCHHPKHNNNNNEKRLYQIAKEKVHITFNELHEVGMALLHHPLITADTVFTVSRFLEWIVCMYWSILLLPHIIQSHTSMKQIRMAFLKLNGSALHANPQDAAD